VTDYGHELLFGTFITPANAHPEAVVGLAQLSEELGLDLVTFQDHPYQAAFLDTWTLMSYVAASTASIHIAPNVLNLPLRPPAVVARAAASLDLLSGGRFELGLGAGAFGEAVAAMGGPHRTPGEAVEALAEAVTILRELWDTSVRGGVRVAGQHYTVNGVKRGPAPVHPIGIWLGAYKPRMLRLTGRVADGWLPSAGYLPPDELAAANAIIDEAASAVDRPPADIRRLYNLSGSFGTGSGFLQGPPGQWVEQLTRLALDDGIGTFILGTDDPDDIARFAEEVAPAVREAVATGRARVGEPVTAADSPVATRQTPTPAPVVVRGSAAAGGTFPVAFTRDSGVRLSQQTRWVESERPGGPVLEPGQTYTAQELASSRQLVAVHDHLRAELEQVRDLIGQVLDGSLPAGKARSRINEMTMRQNSWTVGAYCAAYCRVVTTHHTIEDQALFPRLRRGDPRLAAVVDRLHYEHEIIHDVLEEVDRALVAFVGPDGDGRELQVAVDALSDTLLSHLSYEERELLEPIARLGVLV
jgi:alkanesulfonate monooxygenase SsuD/methylene tetrahydromethanopterin reductase-like flavin-dependent oxidoreductase (luciferase family)